MNEGDEPNLPEDGDDQEPEALEQDELSVRAMLNGTLMLCFSTIGGALFAAPVLAVALASKFVMPWAENVTGQESGHILGFLASSLIVAAGGSLPLLAIRWLGSAVGDDGGGCLGCLGANVGFILGVIVGVRFPLIWFFEFEPEVIDGELWRWGRWLFFLVFTLLGFAIVVGD